MKITRRSDRPGSGHLLISVPAARIEEVEEALTHLEGERGESVSELVINLILSAARRKGWRPVGKEERLLPRAISSL